LEDDREGGCEIVNQRLYLSAIGGASAFLFFGVPEVILLSSVFFALRLSSIKNRFFRSYEVYGYQYSEQLQIGLLIVLFSLMACVRYQSFSMFEYLVMQFDLDLEYEEVKSTCWYLMSLFESFSIITFNRIYYRKQIRLDMSVRIERNYNKSIIYRKRALFKLFDIKHLKIFVIVCFSMFMLTMFFAIVFIAMESQHVYLIREFPRGKFNSLLRVIFEYRLSSIFWFVFLGFSASYCLFGAVDVSKSISAIFERRHESVG
jgi:hypothetical protein